MIPKRSFCCYMNPDVLLLPNVLKRVDSKKQIYLKEHYLSLILCVISKI